MGGEADPLRIMQDSIAQPVELNAQNPSWRIRRTEFPSFLSSPHPCQKTRTMVVEKKKRKIPPTNELFYPGGLKCENQRKRDKR